MQGGVHQLMVANPNADSDTRHDHQQNEHSSHRTHITQEHMHVCMNLIVICIHT